MKIIFPRQVILKIEPKSYLSFLELSSVSIDGISVFCSLSTFLLLFYVFTFFSLFSFILLYFLYCFPFSCFVYFFFFFPPRYSRKITKLHSYSFVLYYNSSQTMLESPALWWVLLPIVTAMWLEHGDRE